MPPLWPELACERAEVLRVPVNREGMDGDGCSLWKITGPRLSVSRILRLGARTKVRKSFLWMVWGPAPRPSAIHLEQEVKVEVPR